MKVSGKIRFFLLVSTGVLTSPNFPDNYPENLHTIETIKVEEGLIISIKFTVFNIELDPECGVCGCDYLTIVDGDGTTLMGKSCGSPVWSPQTPWWTVVGSQSLGISLPPDVVSRSNVVKLLFRTTSLTSDGLGLGLGGLWFDTKRRSWNVSWSAVTPGFSNHCVFFG